jgi:hypothetical protein
MKQQAVETNGCRGPTVNKLFSHTRATGAEERFADFSVHPEAPRSETWQGSRHRSCIKAARCGLEPGNAPPTLRRAPFPNPRDRQHNS